VEFVKKLLSHGRADFLAGVAVVLPVAVSVAVVIWLFGAISNATDSLLLLAPKDWIRNGEGSLHLYSRILALLVGLLLIGLVGRIERYYFGKKLIRAFDVILLRVPLLRKLYRGVKQINEAFTSSKASSFKQVVLVEFPRPGLYSLGFITGLNNPEAQTKTQKTLLCVFVPTPPLTSGSIVLVPETDVVKLTMSVSDGLKFIMSLGSVSPAYPSREKAIQDLGELEEPGVNGATAWVAPLAAPNSLIP
jgi:uncharacterized membrane protein